MIVRNARGERRLSAQQYRFLLSAHIVVSVGWLGVLVAKLALLWVATSSATAPAVGSTMYLAVATIDRVFPAAAILTMVSGVLLGLGTKWGVLDYTWVVTKLVLTVAVPATAIRFGDRLLRQILADAGGQAVAGGPRGAAESLALLVGLDTPATALFALGILHLLALLAATVLSVYKPWGKTWIGNRKAAPRATPVPAH